MARPRPTRLERELKEVFALTDQLPKLRADVARTKGEGTKAREELNASQRALKRTDEAIKGQQKHKETLEAEIAGLTRLKEKLASGSDTTEAEALTASAFKEGFDAELAQAGIIPLVDITPEIDSDPLSPGEISLQQGILRRDSIQRQRNGIFVLIKSVLAAYPFKLVERRRVAGTGIEILLTMDDSNKKVRNLYTEPPRIRFTFSIVEGNGFEVICHGQYASKSDIIKPDNAAGDSWDMDIAQPSEPEATASRSVAAIRALARKLEAKFYESAEPLYKFNDPKTRSLDID